MTSDSFQTFGELLTYLRKRARLTQEELARAVGYGREQIVRLEKNQRVPDRAVIAAVFIPALDLDAAPELAQRLLDLASRTRPLRHNLPAQVTSFIGREADVAHVRDYLLAADQRLVTLIGSPGIGKTRLSLQVAHDVLPAFVDGVYFVPLASMTDPDLVAPAVVQTLGLVQTDQRSALERLKEGINDRQLLLVLDNFEQVIEAASLAPELLAACPRLKLIVTSRESLRVPGEWLYPVPALNIPTTLQLRTLTVDEVAPFTALMLFAERARAMQPEFRLTVDNLSTVAAICTCLAGLPLAIELIAARIRLMTPEVLLSRLTSEFTLHADGMRGVPARQKTLHNAIAWSYALLSPAEQTLLRRLSVFAGGWTLEAAEAVCADEVEVDPYVSPGAVTQIGADEVLDVLTRLVNKSLVVVMEELHGGETRYRMLEPIRQYAREELLETGGGENVRDRHLAYFVKLVEQAGPELYHSNQVFWVRKLDDELDNLRLALEWALVTDVAAGLRIAILPWRWWNFREEGAWLARLLDHYHTVDTLYARGLALYANSFSLQSNFSEAIKLAEQSVQLARTLSDRPAEAFSLSFLGILTLNQGSVGEGIPLLEQSLAMYRALEDKIGQATVTGWLSFGGNSERAIAYTQKSLQLNRELGYLEGIAEELTRLAQLTTWQGDFYSAGQWLEEALAISCELGTLPREATSLEGVGLLAYWQGDYPRAMACYVEAMQLREKIGDHYQRFWDRVNMAYALLRQGDIQLARQLFEDTIRDAHKAAFTIALVFAAEGLASLHVSQEQIERAARLFAWADATREQIGDHRPPVEQASVERDLAIIHARLDDMAFEQAYQTGRAMTLEQAIELALPGTN